MNIFLSRKRSHGNLTAILFLIVAVFGADTARAGVPTPAKKKPDASRYEKAVRHMVSGALFEVKDQYEQAILEYNDALDETPDEAAIYYSLAKSYRKLDKTEDAIKNAQKATELDTTNKWYNDLLGQLYLDTHDYEKAAHQYELLTRKNPGDVSSLYLLATAYSSSNQPAKALPVYDRIIEQVGFELEVLSQKFLLQVQIKDYDGAISTLQDMIIADPYNIELYRTLGDMYSRAGRHTDAVRAYREVLEQDTSDVKALISMGEEYLKLDDMPRFKETILTLFKRNALTLDDKLGVAELYLKRIDTDSTLIKPTTLILGEIQSQHPNEWKVYYFQGALKMNLKSYDDAAIAFKKVTELDPTNTIGWENLGVAYLSAGNYVSAAEELSKGVAKLENPQFRLRLLLGISLNQQARDEEAVQTLEAAIASDSLGLIDKDSKVQAYSTLGISYDRLSRYKESERCYEAALKLDPDNVLVLNNLSYSLSERGIDLDRCLKMAQTAVEKEPDNGAYLDTIGWIYYKLGKYEKAKDWIEKAVGTGRISPVVLEHLGDIYLKLGNKAKAMENWTKSLEQDAQNVSLQEKMNRLQVK
ncbi:MAG: tetratricopeptide repeat protein [Chlorobiales bacterium]|nr:tetratricopeptide repeat protein [Chlorobiales bacterium]